MAALSPNRIAWVYTDDEGNTYSVAAEKAYTDQVFAGGSLSDGTEPPLPYKFQMRRINLNDGAGHQRAMPLYETTAPGKAKGTTVNLNYLNNSTSFKSTGSLRKERPPRRSSIIQTT